MLYEVKLVVTEESDGALLLADPDVREAHHAVSAPAQGDQPTGRRTHDDFRVVITAGPESPILAEAAERNRALRVRLSHIYLHNGATFEGLRIELGGARIVRISDRLPLHRYGSDHLAALVEEIVFRYERISWQCVSALPGTAGRRTLTPVAVGGTFSDTAGGRAAGEAER
jgi:type VI secretion system Hcp family effector